MKHVIAIALLACTVSAQQIRPITQYNDINKVGDEFYTKPVTWFAGDSIRFDVFATDVRTPIDLSGATFPVLFVAAETNVAQVYIAQTGVVVSATGGHVRVSVPATNALLSPAINYAAWMTVYRVVAAETQEIATVAYSSARVLSAPNGTSYSYLTPTNPPWQFTIGSLGSDATNWSDFAAVSRVNLAGRGITNAGVIYGDARGLTNFPASLATNGQWAAAIAAATANMATGTPVYSISGLATGSPVYSLAGYATGTPIYTTEGLATGTPIYSVAGLATGSPVYSVADLSGDMLRQSSGGTVSNDASVTFLSGTVITNGKSTRVAGSYISMIYAHSPLASALTIRGGDEVGTGPMFTGWVGPTILFKNDSNAPSTGTRLAVDKDGHFVRTAASGGAIHKIWDAGQTSYSTLGTMLFLDANTNAYMSLSATGGVRVGTASFHATPDGNIYQDDTNTAALGELTVKSLAFGTNGTTVYSWSSFATGTPVYAEGDPLWTASSGSVAAAIATAQATGVAAFVRAAAAATGTPVYAESDPLFRAQTGTLWAAIMARATGTPIYSVAGLATGIPIYSVAGLATGSPVYSIAGLATGTPIYSLAGYATGTPVYSTAGLATGSPVYAESDPAWRATTGALWTAINAKATGTPVYSVSGLATGTPVYSLAGYATGTPVYSLSGLATGSPVYAESDPLWRAATGALWAAVNSKATGSPVYSVSGLATGSPVYSVAGLATGSPVYAESDPSWQAGTGALWTAASAESAARIAADAALTAAVLSAQADYSNRLVNVNASTLGGYAAADLVALTTFQSWQTNVMRRVFTYPTNGQTAGTFNGVAFTNDTGTNIVAFYFENARGSGTGGWFEVRGALK